jgi:hypothetical protein
MAVHHHHEDSSGSGVNAMAIVAILAILVGVALALWFFVVRGGIGDGQRDINVDVNPGSAIEAPLQHVA